MAPLGRPYSNLGNPCRKYGQYFVSLEPEHFVNSCHHREAATLAVVRDKAGALIYHFAYMKFSPKTITVVLVVVFLACLLSSGTISSSLVEITTAQSFRAIPLLQTKQPNYIYGTDGYKVYVMVHRRVASFPLATDPATFEVIIDQNRSPTPYSKDHKHVYFTGGSDASLGAFVDVLPGADPATFTAIYAGPDMFPMYSKDNSHVYKTAVYDFEYQAIIDGADPATFEVLEQQPNNVDLYARDKDHVYYGSMIVSLADARTFNPVVFPITDTYDAQDGTHKFRRGHIVQ